jgi:hypothetical protein
MPPPCLFQVYQGVWKGETPVAIKILHRDGQGNAISELRQEVDILKACTHPNILRVSRLPKHEL